MACLPNLAWHSGVAIGPCISDIARMIVCHDAAFNHPSIGRTASVWGDDGYGGKSTVHGVIDGDGTRVYVGKDAAHEAEELTVPPAASPVVGKDHTMFVDKVFAKGFDF